MSFQLVSSSYGDLLKSPRKASQALYSKASSLGLTLASVDCLHVVYELATLIDMAIFDPLCCPQ